MKGRYKTISDVTHVIRDADPAFQLLTDDQIHDVIHAMNTKPYEELNELDVNKFIVEVYKTAGLTNQLAERIVEGYCS